jgi:hypothetical protein
MFATGAKTFATRSTTAGCGIVWRTFGTAARIDATRVRIVAIAAKTVGIGNTRTFESFEPFGSFETF